MKFDRFNYSIHAAKLTCRRDSNDVNVNVHYENVLHYLLNDNYNHEEGIKQFLNAERKTNYLALKDNNPLSLVKKVNFKHLLWYFE